MGEINVGRVNWTVISLGGSLIVPNEINTNFIYQFKEVTVKQMNLGKRFIIVCGGGRVARDYQNAYKIIAPVADSNILDWVGINATKLNAQFMVGVFGDLADQRIIDNPNKKIRTKSPIIFAGGWKPGRSTDYVAVLLAHNAKAERIINLTNVDGVYDVGEDGERKELLHCITWDHYMAMIPKKWTPGLSAPFDPIASKEAQRKGIEVAVIGQNLRNFELCLDGERFKGTIIVGNSPNLYPYVQNFKKRRLRRTEDTFLYE